MANSDSGAWRSTLSLYRGILLIAPACLIVGGFLIALAVRGRESAGHIFDAAILELGVAFVIAGILAVTIELYVRSTAERHHEKRQAEIEESIFRHLFGFGLQKPIIDELTETIFASRLVRESLALAYEFETTDAADYVKVKLNVSYRLINTSSGPQRTRIRHYFENTLPADVARAAFTAFRVRGAGTAVSWSREEVAKNVSRAGIRVILAGPEVVVGAGQTVDVLYGYETVRRKADSEVWITTMPTTVMRFTVTLLDGGVRDLAFLPDASHREEPELVTDSPDAELNVFEWRMRSGMLPYQGVVLYWCPKDVVAFGDLADAGAYVVAGEALVRL